MTEAPKDARRKPRIAFTSVQQARELGWAARVAEMRKQGFTPLFCSVFRRGDMLLWVRAKP